MFEDILFYAAAFIWGSLFGYLLAGITRRIDERLAQRRKVRRARKQRKAWLRWRPVPSVEQWRPLVAEYFKPEDVDRALFIIRRASNGDPSAVGDDGHSVGLFQLHDMGVGLGLGDARYDPETNVAVAAAIVYGGVGWRPWAFYERGTRRMPWWQRRLALLRA